MIDAITFKSFNDEPERASRPYDLNREGFVPSHGAGCLVLEELEHAKARGARIYAELLACVATSDGSHLPAPSQEGQAVTLRKVMKAAGIAPEEVQFICAHATSTPLGDISELRAIRDAFGSHAEKLKINAPKSMLGHTCWAAPATESVAESRSSEERQQPTVDSPARGRPRGKDQIGDQVIDAEGQVMPAPGVEAGACPEAMADDCPSRIAKLLH